MIEVLKLINSLSDSQEAICGNYTVRHLTKDEPLPLFGHGYEDSPLLQREWIWIAEVRGLPIALLIAAPCQHLAYLMRIFATKSAPRDVFVGLLRKSLADILSRGYTNFIVGLDLDRPEEAKLGRIVTKAGGKLLGKVSMFLGETFNNW